MLGPLILAFLAGGLEMPPLAPGALMPPALLAEEGPWLPDLTAGEQAYAFVANPYGFPGLWYLGLGIRREPWSLALRQYGNALYRHLRLNWGLRSPRMPFILGVGLESLRLGSYPLEGLWLEAGLPLWQRAPLRLETVAWAHLLRGYRWTGLRLLGLVHTVPAVGFVIHLEPDRPVALAWQVSQRIHRLLGIQIAYRSMPRLLAVTLSLYSRPALVYSVAHHPDLGLSHGLGVLWWPQRQGGEG